MEIMNSLPIQSSVLSNDLFNQKKDSHGGGVGTEPLLAQLIHTSGQRPLQALPFQTFTALCNIP